ncbi:hypothetical protein [Chishuiella sp.]|uniref:hypothetical protein n=1 Tax=Chishuiella sp. TaxID=1969467 RepID=UPI0028AA3F34|nr:hypothetical protein [Chishuiella sp.]
MLTQLIENLENYQLKGNFIFKQNSKLSGICNIPNTNELAGLYLFYDDDTNELLYIGISGRTSKEGNIVFRKDGLRGRFLKGKQFGDFRRNSLPKQMVIESINSLKIKWYGTYHSECFDHPRALEVNLLQTFLKENNRLPRWNKEI